MASLTAATAKHATLSGTTADLVTFSPVHGDSVYLAHALRVTNHDASVLLYFNFNSATVPTSAADDTYVVRAGTSLEIAFIGNVKTIRLVGNGNAYSAEIV